MRNDWISEREQRTRTLVRRAAAEDVSPQERFQPTPIAVPQLRDRVPRRQEQRRGHPTERESHPPGAAAPPGSLSNAERRRPQSPEREENYRECQLHPSGSFLFSFWLSILSIPTDKFHSIQIIEHRLEELKNETELLEVEFRSLNERNQQLLLNVKHKESEIDRIKTR